MFRALKDKVTNEYEKAKVNIQSQALNLVNNGSIANTSGDSSKSSINSPASSNEPQARSKSEANKSDESQHYTEPGFSLVDLDEESSHAPAVLNSTPTQKVHSSSDNDSFFRTNFFSNLAANFVPQSDIESEYESESSNQNVDNVSKEKLIDLCYRLKERSKRYQERWKDVVRAYRTTIEERDKLKNVLAETQDRALRRVNELKEQCNLEQEAKRHLEENLQVLIEEKEEQIKVLRTKLDLINTSDIKTDLINLDAGENEELTKKIENLELSLSQGNEKLDSVTKENESLLQYKAQAEKLEKEVEYIKKLKESASASFTEAKQKLHDELESRSIIIKELKDQIEKRNIEIKHKNNEVKTKNETIKALNEKASKIESAFETEKSSLMEELSRGKAAAIALLREQFEKQIQDIHEEHESKLQTLTEENALLKKEKTSDDSSTNDSNAFSAEHENQIEEIRQSKEELEIKFTQTRDELNGLKEQLNINNLNHRQELESLELKLTDATKLYQIQETKINELNANIVELDNLKQQLQTTEKQLEETNKDNDLFKEQLQSMRDQIQEKDQSISQLNVDIKSLESQSKEQLEKYQQQLEQFQKQTVSSAEMQEMESKIETLKEKNRQKISKIGDLEKAIVAKDSEIIELSKTKNELENEIQTLKVRMDAGNDESTNQLRKDYEKAVKTTEVTKKLIETLKKDNAAALEEAKELRESNAHLAQEKNRLTTEVNDLNGEVVSFKNKLIDIFYNAYADSEVSDIASLDYGDFLTIIENSYKKVLEENAALSQNISKLEQALQNAVENSEQERSKQNKQLQELQNTNLSLIEEIEKLRMVERQSKHTENVIEEKNNQLTALEENVVSLTSEIQELRSQLESAKSHLKETNFSVTTKEELLQQKSSELAFKENELASALERASNADQIIDQHKETVQQLNEANKLNSQLQEELQSVSSQLALMSKQIEESKRENMIHTEEIAKIKSNAKEILESKHKLQEKLKSAEGKIGSLRNENQELASNNKQIGDEVTNLKDNLQNHEQEKFKLEHKIEELEKLVKDKEQQQSEMRQQLNELENKIDSTNLDQNDLIKGLENKVQNSSERCIELEEKLKMKESNEQELKTEVIALEEKLKLSTRSEKELREDVRINADVNNSLKEQVHKYLSEINELKNELSTIKGKHEQAIDKLYKQLEVRESQLDESVMNANSQYNSTAQDLIKAKSELTRLNKLVEELSSANRDLESKVVNATETSEESQRKLIERYEQQIESLQSKLDGQKQEIAEKMDQFDNIESKLISEHKDLISQMENEISEKSTALEEVHEYYQQRLKAKDNELKHLHEQLTSTDKNNYQINALQNSILQYHEENSRLKELLNLRQEKNGDNNKNNSDMENCAILGVHLPQPTEYEYLRNILFQFMMGREPVTLAKVIAAVMRFSNDQTDQIIRKQEALQAHPKFNKPA